MADQVYVSRMALGADNPMEFMLGKADVLKYMRACGVVAVYPKDVFGFEPRDDDVRFAVAEYGTGSLVYIVDRFKEAVSLVITSASKEDLERRIEGLRRLGMRSD
ncbi:MAG: hypothetical protein ABIH41_07225 [Nanoarchaeota archaeon]